MMLNYIDEFFKSKFGPEWRKLNRETLELEYQNSFYPMIRMAVRRACKAIFKDGRVYSPADARSTFAANRRAKLGLQQTKEDLGHSSSVITRSHYAGPQKAWDR